LAGGTDGGLSKLLHHAAENADVAGAGLSRADRERLLGLRLLSARS